MAIDSFNIFVSTWNCNSHSTKQEWVFLQVEFQRVLPSGINYSIDGLLFKLSILNKLTEPYKMRSGPYVCSICNKNNTGKWNAQRHIKKYI